MAACIDRQGHSLRAGDSETEGSVVRTLPGSEALGPVKSAADCRLALGCCPVEQASVGPVGLVFAVAQNLAAADQPAALAVETVAAAGPASRPAFPAAGPAAESVPD